MDRAKNVRRAFLARFTFFRIVYYLGACSLFALCLKPELYRLTVEREADAATGAAEIAQTFIFRDDFQSRINSAWTWENEDQAYWQIAQNGWLEITGGHPSRLAGGAQRNLLWTFAPQTDFIAITHLKTQPLFNYQQSGLLFFDEAGRYVSLGRGYCMECVLGGNGVFLENNLDGARARLALPTAATDLYLMLIQMNNTIGAFYALEGEPWQNVGNLQNSALFERVGLSVTNESQWDEGYDVIGQFDFFELRPSFHQTPPPRPTYVQQIGNF